VHLGKDKGNSEKLKFISYILFKYHVFPKLTHELKVGTSVTLSVQLKNIRNSKMDYLKH
jgi:hypothetical protein